MIRKNDMKIDPISWQLVKNIKRSELVTLMYHSVCPGSNTPDWLWAVSYKAFCEQMDLLKELGWHTIFSHEVANLSELPQRSVLITFDDGYANNFDAFQALVTRNMNASWFIVSGVVGGKPGWLEHSNRQFDMLTISQLREMVASGMEIGSHTVSHCRLPEVDDKKLEIELSDSQKQLSDMIGCSVNTMAYPYGYYDARVSFAACNAGYNIGFTTTCGFGLEVNDIMQVRRVSIFNSDNLSTFARKLAFGLNDVSWKALRSYTQNGVKQRMRTLLHKSKKHLNN